MDKAKEKDRKEIKDKKADKEANKKTVAKDKNDLRTEAQRKLGALNAKKSGIDTTKKSNEPEPVKIAPVRSSIVVRVVNCSGAPAAGDVAAYRLRSAGFTVIRGGSGEIIAETTVISTTNNGAIVSKLSNVPFAHTMRITRDGAADCDGVVMIGKNFR